MTQTPTPDTQFGEILELIPNLRSAGDLLTEVQSTVVDIVALRMVTPDAPLPNPLAMAREIAPNLIEELRPEDVAVFNIVEAAYLFVLEAVRESVRIRAAEMDHGEDI